MINYVFIELIVLILKCRISYTFMFKTTQNEILTFYKLSNDLIYQINLVEIYEHRFVGKELKFPVYQIPILHFLTYQNKYPNNRKFLPTHG